MSDKLLPPLPKLRPRPGFHMPNMIIGDTNISPPDDIAPPHKKRKITHVPFSSVPVAGMFRSFNF